MRLPLLFLIFLSSVAALSKSWTEGITSLFSREERPEHERLPNFYDLPQEAIHKRVKRAVYAALGFASQCEPGWTGQYCENPICSDVGTLPSNTYAYQLLDILSLPSGCTGKYYVPVDSNSFIITIEVNAAGKAFVNLTDANGNVMPNEGMITEGYTMVRYTNIPPGPYQMTIDNGGIPTTNCIAEITSYSGLSVVQRFSSSPQSDVAPYSESAMEGSPMYFIAHVNNLTNPGEVRAVTIRTQSSTVPVYRSLLTKRFICAYEYYAGQFLCTRSNRYIYHVDGIDAFGYAYRRSGTFSCLQPAATTAPPTPVTPSTHVNCANGGTPLYQGSVNATCFCPELFYGRECDQVNCMNGGTPLDGNQQCLCPPGFKGVNCQTVSCTVNEGPYLTDTKTLIVVIRTTTSMSQYISQIVNAITAEVENNNMYETDVYQSYVLVKFANGQYETQYYAQSIFQMFLNDLMDAIYTKNVGGCNETTFNAISSVFVEPISPKSSIYVFTDVVASDPNSWRTVAESNTRRKLPIYMNVLPNKDCPLNVYSEGYRALTRASAYSGGLVQQPTLESLEPIFQFTMRSTSYKMNAVLMDDMNQCDTGGSRFFLVDSSVEAVIIFAVGQNLVLSVTDPNWDKTAAMLIYNYGTSYFWEVTSVIPGEYMLSLSATNVQNSCSYRVMARSDFDLFLATANVIDEDASDSEPVVGKSKHIVAQLNGLVNAVQDPFRLFAEIAITTNMNSEGKVAEPMYFSNGKYRSGCGYHLYFGQASFCQFQDQQFYATVFADDNNGYTIQRTTTGYCSMTETTPVPPTACQNGGVLDPTNNKSCICPPNYGGDHCESAICQNGGTSYGSFCACLPGRGGTFCELYACTDINTKPQISFDGQSMSIVLAARPSMLAPIQALSAGITDFVRDVQDSSSSWIVTWNLVVVNNIKAFMVYTGSNPDDFVRNFKQVAGNLSAYYSGNEAQNCSVMIESGLLLSTYYSEPRSAVYLFADSDGPNSDVFTDLFSRATEYQISLNLIGVANTICTDPANNGQFPAYLRDLASLTSGFVYMTPNSDKMLPFIASSYKSGIASRVYFEDCSNITYYVPIDASTASFTLAISGSNISNVVVTLPDGSPGLNNILSVPMISAPELNIQQFIQACDGYQWNYRDQYCYRFVFQKYTWLKANQFCHGLGGYMADVHSQAKDDYIKKQTNDAPAWIGLIKNNNQWVWDVPDGNTYQNLGDYTNWKPGVDINNPAFNCVYSDENGLWVPADCSEQYYPVCQKFRYGQGISPGSNNTNAVPAGLWKIQIETVQGGCVARVNAQSDIQVFYGFTLDAHEDYPELYANSQSNSNYMIVDAVGLSPFHYDVLPSLEGRLNYAILGYNYNQTTPLVIQDRQLCGYPQVSTSFSCPQTGSITDFFVKFSGIDQFGYTFDRYTNAICTKAGVNCNHGFSNNGKCICDAGYGGPTCATPICQNYGYESNGRCFCQRDYTGTFCELPVCEQKYPGNFVDSGRTFVIMLETSYNMGSTIFQMKKNLKIALDKMKNDPTTTGWFNKYILYPFDSSSNKPYWYPPVISSNSDDIVAAVNNITIMSCPGPDGCSPNCPRPIMETLKTVLALPDVVRPNSVVLVVSPSSPEDYPLLNGMIQTLIDSKIQLNFVLPAITSPCGEGWNTPAANAMNTAISYSDGNVFVMSPVDFAVNFLQQYLPSLYQSEGLEYGIANCTYQELLFQVEHVMYEFSIEYYHPIVDPPAMVTLTDPAGDSVPLPPNLIASTTNYLAVIKVNDTGAIRAGTYRLTMTGGGGSYCNMNIRGRSAVEIYPAYVRSTDDAHGGATTDNSHYAPVLDENNTIVVHANNLVDGSLTYVQVIAPGGVGLQHTSVLLPRDSKSCSFEYYAPVPFVCSYEQYIVIVYGQDYLGATIRRKFVTNCVSTRPVAPPPEPTCDMTAVKQDTLFIIDSSLNNANSEGIFTSLRDYAVKVQLPFQFSPSYSQVAAITLADTAQGGFSFNAPEGSYDNVKMLLSNLTFLGRPGQSVTSAMQLVINSYDSENQGYRPSARHLIVYVTNTNPTDDDPASLVYTIRRQGLYQVAVVTMGLTPSDKLLSLVSSKCMYQAADVNDLMTNGVYFVQNLACASSPRCGY